MTSRLKPKAERKKLDQYFTPPQLARFICSRLVDYLGQPQHIVEPHSGRGAFVAAARIHWPDARIVAFDLDGRAKRHALRAGADAFIRADWLGREEPRYCSPDLIIGNCPYNDALRHVEASLERVKPLGFVAFLLRLTFFGSRERQAFWRRRNLRYLLPIYPRPRFADQRTDFSDYAVFCWQRDYVGTAEVLPNLHWEEEG
jgi:hypothetical protein